MQKDLVRSYCGGNNKRFNAVVCDSYISGTGECELLEEILKMIFEQGRCKPDKMLHRSVEKNLLQYKDLIEPDDHIRPVAFQIRKRIETKQLDRAKKRDIVTLKRYINVSAYNEVVKMLQKEGFLQEKKCGNCLWLAESHAEKHICERKFLDEKNSIENPFYKKKRRPSDRDCKQGFQPVRTLSLEDNPGAALPEYHMPKPEESCQAIAEDLLRKRIKNASAPNKRAVFQRHWTVFRERFVMGEDNKDIALKIGVAVRTVERDLKEILEYLKINVSKN